MWAIVRTAAHHYRSTLLFGVICIALGAWYGWSITGSLAQTASVLWVILVLSILEISLSFDNAIVNASVLKDMDEVWQKRFLTWGIAFAVFGMRVIFPLAIVAIAASLGPVDALSLALKDTEKYQALVSSAHVGIAGFGGAFLAMVGMKFFFDAEKDVHWVQLIERQLAKFAALPAAEIAILLLAISGISHLLSENERSTFLISGMLGLVAFILIEGVSALLEKKDQVASLGGAAIRSGLGGFVYLNILDASFSFDGVIGAFALSTNMVIIALGLSIGAMFVRSMTTHLVKKGTLTQYRYLEHGAFWAILALAGIMLLSARYEIPETITGLIGAALICVSLAWSVRHNRNQKFVSSLEQIADSSRQRPIA